MSEVEAASEVKSEIKTVGANRRMSSFTELTEIFGEFIYEYKEMPDLINDMRARRLPKLNLNDISECESYEEDAPDTDDESKIG